MKFINKVPSFGKSFICIDDKNNVDLLKKLKIKNYYTYGTNPTFLIYIKNIKQLKKFSEYDLSIKLPEKNSSYQLIKLKPTFRNT